VLRFFVNYVLLSQIPRRTFNQCGYMGQSTVPQLCQLKERSVTLAAFSGNSGFTQIQTKITQFEGVAFFFVNNVLLSQIP